MKYLYIFIICFLLGCTPSWYLLGNVQYIQYNKELTINLFDSLCHADTLSNRLLDWVDTPLLDEETKNPIKRYLYIKNGVYILTIQDSIYNVTKRIIQ